MTRELRAMRRQAIAHLTKGMASSTATSVPQPVLSKDSTENIPPQSVATVDTWDVFDTLIARYCFAPGEVSEIVARRINHPQFLEQRLGAQQELD